MLQKARARFAASPFHSKKNDKKVEKWEQMYIGTKSRWHFF